jgi:flagellar biosynthetic protein FlhB
MGFLGGKDGRTEKATAKRRGEARQKGQIARSQNLPGAFVLLGLFWILASYAPFVIQDLSDLLRRFLTGAVPREFTEEHLQQLFLSSAISISKVLLLVTISAFLLSVSANVAQGGFVFSTYRLGLHFENLNPATGIRRLLGGTSGIELLKSLLTIGILSHLAHSIYLDVASEVPKYVLMAPNEICMRVGSMVYRFAFKSGLYLLAIGFADYYWNRYKFEQDLKMTKQEVKDEAKNAEGSPEVRSKIRRRQKEIATRNMMAAIPKADVVITNPTHYAVALSYQSERMAAPTVIAKGRGFVALRIREIATENRVPFVENKPLAQSLYKAVEVGEQIPGSLFKAVAEVLAYVYKLKRMRL